MTLFETVTAASLSSVVLTSAVACYLASAGSALNGQNKMDTQIGAQSAVRVISKELREAVSLSVDSDGKGLTYTRPRKSESGNYEMPLVTDGVNRRVWIDDDGMLRMTSDGGNTSRVLCKGVVTYDPKLTQNFIPFRAGAGSIARSLTIKVICQTSTTGSNSTYTAAREVIFLRNIPQLNQ